MNKLGKLVWLFSLFACAHCVRAIYQGPTPPAPDSAPLDSAVHSSDALLQIDGKIWPDALRPAISWTQIAAGSYVMGSPDGENCHQASEAQHQVTLSHDFQLSTYEITQRQFSEVRRYNSSANILCDGNGQNCPVEMINWHESVAFCNELSTLNGLPQCYNCSGPGTAVICSSKSQYAGGNIYKCPGYRLPTTAEWEYAYRADSTSGLYNGTEVGAGNCTQADPNAGDIGWYVWNTGGSSHRVGDSKPPNAWGLYDMAGNVWERMHDFYTLDLGTAAVVDPNPVADAVTIYSDTRGASWLCSYSQEMRAALRAPTGLLDRQASIGLRCARSLNPSPPAAYHNVAAGVLPTANSAVSEGRLYYLTDGSINTSYYIGFLDGPRYLVLDLGKAYALDQIKLWHYYGDGRIYHDVIVQLSNNADFSSGVTTIFNNDADNSAGQGAGADAEYTESAGGKTISFAATSTRYLRVWSNGNTLNTSTHFLELEAWGN